MLRDQVLHCMLGKPEMSKNARQKSHQMKQLSMCLMAVQSYTQFYSPEKCRQYLQWIEKRDYTQLWQHEHYYRIPLRQLMRLQAIRLGT